MGSIINDTSKSDILPWKHVIDVQICTVHGRASLHFRMGCPSLAQNCSLPWVDPDPSNTIPWAIRVHKRNGISISSAIFAQMTTECPYTLQWLTPSLLKLPLPMGDVEPHLIHGSFGPSKSSTQTASRSVRPFLHGSLV